MINGSMGLMGASDTTWILARKKRTDENTAFVATGRDISDINLVLYLDKSVFHWEVIGTAEKVHLPHLTTKSRTERSGV